MGQDHHNQQLSAYGLGDGRMRFLARAPAHAVQAPFQHSSNNCGASTCATGQSGTCAPLPDMHPHMTGTQNLSTQRCHQHQLWLGQETVGIPPLAGFYGKAFCLKVQVQDCPQLGSDTAMRLISLSSRGRTSTNSVFVLAGNTLLCSKCGPMCARFRSSTCSHQQCSHANLQSAGFDWQDTLQQRPPTLTPSPSAVPKVTAWGLPMLTHVINHSCPSTASLA